MPRFCHTGKMKRLFVALRFAEDKNISDRMYWYLSEFPLSLGERVLAPVGMHDRIQCAVVERTLEAEENDAPYDIRLIKRVEARAGARKLVAGGEELLEFGGIKYDEKHYTRFGQLLLARQMPDRAALDGLGVTKVSERADFTELAHTNGCMLVVGREGRRMFEALISFCRGGGLDADGDTKALLRGKLL